MCDYASVFCKKTGYAQLTMYIFYLFYNSHNIISLKKMEFYSLMSLKFHLFFVHLYEFYKCRGPPLINFELKFEIDRRIYEITKA